MQKAMAVIVASGALVGCVSAPRLTAVPPTAGLDWSVVDIVADAATALPPAERARLATLFARQDRTARDNTVLTVIPAYSFRPGEMTVIESRGIGIVERANPRHVLRGRRWQAVYALTLIGDDGAPRRVFRVVQTSAKAARITLRQRLFDRLMRAVEASFAQSSATSSSSGSSNTKRVPSPGRP